MALCTDLETYFEEILSTHSDQPVQQVGKLDEPWEFGDAHLGQGPSPQL